MALGDILYVQKRRSLKGKRSSGFFAYAFFTLHIFVHSVLLAYIAKSTVKRKYIQRNLKLLWTSLLLEIASFAGATGFAVLFVCTGWISLCCLEYRKQGQ